MRHMHTAHVFIQMKCRQILPGPTSSELADFVMLKICTKYFQSPLKFMTYPRKFNTLAIKDSTHPQSGSFKFKGIESIDIDRDQLQHHHFCPALLHLHAQVH